MKQEVQVPWIAQELRFKLALDVHCGGIVGIESEIGMTAVL